MENVGAKPMFSSLRLLSQQMKRPTGFSGPSFAIFPFFGDTGIKHSLSKSTYVP